MKIIAFATSNSQNSINRMLVTHAVDVFHTAVDADAEIEVLELNDFAVPLYGVDLEAESGIPSNAKLFFDKIGESDALIVSHAEHNGTYTAAWKSLFDWMSRIDMKVFQGKPMVVFATSPGRGGGASVLKFATDSAPHFGAETRASLSVPSFNHNFDAETGKLTNEDLASKLLEALGSLKKV